MPLLRPFNQWPDSHFSIELGQIILGPTMSQLTRVAVVAFNGIRPFHLAVPCAVFGEAAGAAPLFDLRVCALETGPLRTQAGFSMTTTHGPRALGRAQIVVVPSWRDAHEMPPTPLLKAVERAHQRGATVVGLCLGAFVLAEAGILDGRRATTHWRWADLFAQRYPKVQVDPGVLYVDAGDVLTSAGTAAGIDCCLHLVRRQCGWQAANRIARTLVVPPQRQGSQAQFIDQPMPRADAPNPLTTVLDWAVRHLGDAHSLDALAARAAMSRRSFTRHFRQYTGTTVGQWLLGQRLALAQRLLETGNASVERIADDAGFGSAQAMRQHFIAAFQTTPRAYRREFGQPD